MQLYPMVGLSVSLQTLLCPIKKLCVILSYTATIKLPIFFVLASFYGSTKDKCISYKQLYPACFSCNVQNQDSENTLPKELRLCTLPQMKQSVLSSFGFLFYVLRAKIKDWN